MAGSATMKTNVLVAVVVVVCVVVAVIGIVGLDATGRKGNQLSKEFIYDIKDKAKVDPELILFEESSKEIDSGLKNTRAIALDSEDNIYIAGDRLIKMMSSDGETIDTIELDGEPTCLAVSDEGRIYVGVRDHVRVYGRKGGDEGGAELLARWQGLGPEAVLTSIATCKDDVFVADAGNRIVLRYDTGGKLLNRIGRKDKDKGIGGFSIPSAYFDLAVGSDGLLRVVNPGRHRIEAYTFDGDLEFWWGDYSSGVEGFCGCCNPINFAILADESFVTCEKGLVRVKIYDAEGDFVGVVAGPEQLVAGGECRVCEVPAMCQSGGFDVAVDSRQRVLVLDTIRGVVRSFVRKKPMQGQGDAEDV